MLTVFYDMDITECLATENTEMMNAVTLRKMGQLQSSFRGRQAAEWMGDHLG